MTDNYEFDNTMCGTGKKKFSILAIDRYNQGLIPRPYLHILQ